MTIRIFLGNVGSCKSLCAVREIASHPDQHYFSNIITKGLKNNTVIDAGMIMKEEDYEKDGKTKTRLVVNREFWEEQQKKYQQLNVIVDEAHALINARRAMSKKTAVFMEWLALIRKVLGSLDATGDLILISQLERRLDVLAKEMCNEVRFFISRYVKICRRCRYSRKENNEMPELMRQCPRCGNIYFDKLNHCAEVWHFQGMDEFVKWKYMGMRKQYYRHYILHGVKSFYTMYDSLQWDNLLGEN